MDWISLLGVASSCSGPHPLADKLPELNRTWQLRYTNTRYYVQVNLQALYLAVALPGSYVRTMILTVLYSIYTDSNT